MKGYRTVATIVGLVLTIALGTSVVSTASGGQAPAAASKAAAPATPPRGVAGLRHGSDGAGPGPVLLWDNGDTNGVEAANHQSSPRRSIMDDFTIADAAWTIEKFQTLLLWDGNNDPGTAVDVNLAVYGDVNGEPGPWICDLTSLPLTYQAISTGRMWFDLDEWDISIRVQPFALEAGSYWIDMQVVGQGGERSFQMSKDDALIRDSELWIRYDDIPPVPQRGSDQAFNQPIDTSFMLLGSIDPPLSERVCPIGFDVNFGAYSSGVVEDMCASDDVKVIVLQRAAISPLLPVIRLTTVGIASGNAPLELSYTLEASANALPANSMQRIELRNYDTSSWETVDSRLATTTDQTIVLTFNVNPTRFVEEFARSVQSRLNWFDPGDVFFASWGARMDVAAWDLVYQVPTPPHDDCANAKVFDGVGDIHLDLAGATIDGPPSACGPAAPDVWYQWTSDCDGTITLDPSAGRVVVHDGTCGNLGTEIGCATAPGDVQFAATDGQSFMVQVVDPSGGGITGTLSISCDPDPPGLCKNTSGIPNDCCQDATTLTEANPIPFDTTGANTDGPAPPPSSCLFGKLVTSDLWYCYTAPQDGVATIEVCNTDFSSRLVVYGPFSSCSAVCPVDNGSLVACEQRLCGPGDGAALDVGVTSGMQYLIRVGGLGEEGTGTVEVTSAPVNNDICEGAPEVIVGGSIDSDTTGSTVDVVPTCNGQVPSENGVWVWVRGDGTELLASLCDSETPGLSMNVYCATCEDLECVAAESFTNSNCVPWAEVTWCSEVDHVYWILVWAELGVDGPFTLNMFSNGPCGPAFDCQNAQCAVDCSGTPEAEACGGATNNGCSQGENYETALTGVRYCGTYWADNFQRDEDWWQFTLDPGDTSFTVDYAGDIATALRIIDLGEPFDCQSATELVLSTTFPCQGGATGITGLRDGGTYVVVVTTRDDLGTGFPCGQFSRYNFTITSGAVPGPSNNDCADAITVLAGLTAFDNINATTDGPDEPFECSFFGYTHIDADVWFNYTATIDGTVTINLCDSDYDTKMAVYDVTCLGLGTNDPIACNDDRIPDCTPNDLGSEVVFGASQGATYLIRIGGFEGDQGTGTMDISIVP